MKQAGKMIRHQAIKAAGNERRDEHGDTGEEQRDTGNGWMVGSLRSRN